MLSKSGEQDKDHEPIEPQFYGQRPVNTVDVRPAKELLEHGKIGHRRHKIDVTFGKSKRANRRESQEGSAPVHGVQSGKPRENEIRNALRPIGGQQDDEPADHEEKGHAVMPYIKAEWSTGRMPEHGIVSGCVVIHKHGESGDASNSVKFAYPAGDGI